MRLALISDIHGNCVGLDAVLADLEQLGVEDGICLGDAAQGGPQPAEALDRLQELGWPVVLGNADDFVLSVPEQPAEPVSESQLQVREWTLSQLTDAHRALIDGFAATVERDFEGGGRLLAFHGSPRSYDDVLLPETEPSAAYEADAEVLAGGHTHLQWTRRLGSALFANPGSVGLAYDRHQPPEDFRATPIAEYALLHADDTGVAVEFRRVPFDLERLLAAGLANGRPHADEYAGQWRLP